MMRTFRVILLHVVLVVLVTVLGFGCGMLVGWFFPRSASLAPVPVAIFLRC